MMEGLVWSSLLSLLVKRLIGLSVQQLTAVELSTFMVAKNTQGYFYQLMELIMQNILSKLKKTCKNTINFLSKYAKRSPPTEIKNEAIAIRIKNHYFLKSNL